ncbi:MAG: asparagine synthase (glutamine-hydrolyzing) [Candidatus Limnocylindria bacterium]
MCGIAGIVAADSERRADARLRRMLSRLSHRGPDEEGVLVMGGATLGARRLAIIDLVDGRQPMANEAGDVIAVQNGEIYNFAELRDALRDLGHRFRTRNDTEVLPHAYEEWGVDLVPRLRGMFALAVWDERRRRLLLARDRFGKKPLVYHRTPHGLVFASELQALWAYGDIPIELDIEGIEEYLTFGYVPAPRTAFAAVRKLPPGHTLVFEAGNVSVERYWHLAFSPKLEIGLEEAAEELRRRVDDAVRVRLMSDVPIGAFLSGGLDSSTVVAFMARHSERAVKTFSIGFKDESHDELGYARLVARAFGTDHDEFVVDAGEAEVLPMLVRHLGEPFADSSIVPTYHVARITRSKVTVALNGDGGDELFAGYDRYKAAALTRLTFERLPAPLVRSMASLARRLRVPAALPASLHRGRRYLSALDLAPEARHLRWTGYFTGPLRELIAGSRLRERPRPEPLLLLARAAELTGATDAAERYMASDVLMYLPGDLLVKMDIATMATSLEARSPLLDHELAEYVARLPASLKLSVRTSKILLRHAMRGILPDEILSRGKMGFSAPVGGWLRGPLRPLFEDLALTSHAADAGLLSQKGIRILFAEHVSGAADRTPLLWCVLMLELWYRECVERAAAREAA